MYNSIIISACLFGSFYMFSDSLRLINQSLLKNKMPGGIIIIDSLVCLGSGAICVFSINLLYVLNSKNKLF